MRIFLSWSGQRSKAVAQALRSWLKNVVQALDPWMSDKDIAVGSQWFGEISGELDKAHAGVLCVTRESLKSQWFLFEAGALAKHVKRDRACPYVIDLDEAELDGPLAGLQSAKANKEGTLKLVETLNGSLRLDASDRALSDEALRASFDIWWPSLEAKLGAALAMPSTSPTSSVPDVPAMVKETLLTVRDLASDVRQANLISTGVQRALSEYANRASTQRLAQVVQLPHLVASGAVFPPSVQGGTISASSAPPAVAPPRPSDSVEPTDNE